MKQFETIKKHIKWEKYYDPDFNWNDEEFYYYSKAALSEDFIREFQDKVNWEYISLYQKLSEEFIREFQDKVNWEYISCFQKLSEDFIREFQDKVYWKSIYYSLINELTSAMVNDVWKTRIFSEDFIREFQDKMNWDKISKLQRLLLAEE